MVSKERILDAEITRRGFLAAIGLGAAAALGACGNNEGVATPTSTETEQATSSPSATPSAETLEGLTPEQKIGKPDTSFEGLNVSAPDDVIQEALKPISGDLPPKEAFKQLGYRLNVWMNSSRSGKSDIYETEESKKTRDKLTEVIYSNKNPVHLEDESTTREIIGIIYDYVTNVRGDAAPEPATFQESFVFSSITKLGDGHYSAKIDLTIATNFLEVDPEFTKKHLLDVNGRIMRARGSVEIVREKDNAWRALHYRTESADDTSDTSDNA